MFLRNSPYWDYVPNRLKSKVSGIEEFVRNNTKDKYTLEDAKGAIAIGINNAKGNTPLNILVGMEQGTSFPRLGLGARLGQNDNDMVPINQDWKNFINSGNANLPEGASAADIAEVEGAGDLAAVWLALKTVWTFLKGLFGFDLEAEIKDAAVNLFTTNDYIEIWLAYKSNGTYTANLKVDWLCYTGSGQGGLYIPYFIDQSNIAHVFPGGPTIDRPGAFDTSIMDRVGNIAGFSFANFNECDDVSISAIGDQLPSDVNTIIEVINTLYGGFPQIAPDFPPQDATQLGRTIAMPVENGKPIGPPQPVPNFNAGERWELYGSNFPPGETGGAKLLLPAAAVAALLMFGG